MQLEPTDIPEVVLIKPTVYGDAREFIFEAWDERDFSEAGLGFHFVQDSHSYSGRHTLRGLHYQVVQPQGRLVCVATGSAFNVAVDVRRGSPTCGRWMSVVLSSDNHHMLWIPAGFAHGFLVLSESAHFLNRCTEFWAPTHERTIRWDDADLRIDWPLPRGLKPQLSAKDESGCWFRDAELLSPEQPHRSRQAHPDA